MTPCGWTRCVSKPSPARYRTTNWSIGTASLRKRGSLLICLDKEMTWLAPHDGSPGRPAVFSDAAIQLCLTIKVPFKLPLRQTTGMVASLLKLAGLCTRPALQALLDAHDPQFRGGVRDDEGTVRVRLDLAPVAQHIALVSSIRLSEHGDGAADHVLAFHDLNVDPFG